MIKEADKYKTFIENKYGKLTVQEIAIQLDIDYYTVRYLIKKMREEGYKFRYSLPWTTEEDEKLLEVYGHSSMEKMIEIFKRSERAIISRMKRLTGSEDKGYNSGYLTTVQLADIMGVTYCSVDRWIKDRDLKIHKVGQRRYIIPYKFWRWAKENTDWLDFRCYQYGSIGEEPRWLKGVIEEQKAQNKHKRREWTVKEISTLDWMVDGGKKDDEIAKVLGRSKASVKRKRLRRQEERKHEG